MHESDIENLVIDLLQEQGYKYTSPEELETERADLSSVILLDRLRTALQKLNPNQPQEILDKAIKQILNLPHPQQNLIENNEAFHKMLVDGINIEYSNGGETIGTRVKVIDFDNFSNNEFLVTNQFTVIQNGKNRRADVVIFVNGLPLVVLELKNAEDERASLKRAYTQLQNYKKDISTLFEYNSLLVISDGIDAKVGSLTANYSRFMSWKSKDGKNEDSVTTPQIETLIKGMLNPQILLDLIQNFTVFHRDKKQDPKTGLATVNIVKKVGAYHQYYAVKKAVRRTIEASRPTGDRKIGVIWHTQGSGKSLSMVFYAGELITHPIMKNPTIVVITDRNDLDNQLYYTFRQSKDLLRQTPVRAESREHLKKLLKTAGGGIVFTTIQKFFPEDESQDKFESLSNRKNIVVIADEAHRTQYGFAGKTHIKNNQVFTKYGFAKYLRDALPNASFIGFTGTPIEKQDRSTPAVFGNYIDVYDIEQSIEDGMTVPIYYESRLVKIHLKEELKDKIDYEVAQITENEESTATQKAKAKWTRLEAIVGHKDRLREIAKDIVEHFEKRQQVFEGKAMIVTMSRRIAVDLYAEIIKIRPEWHEDNLEEGVIKVVMTSSSNDPESWQMHRTNKQERQQLANRFKDPKDSLKLVIVRDMWLTGFDVPCLHTMYIDKPMTGANLMQAIARVNRVYKDKKGGLIVDYIGIASDLKKAISTYTESGGKGDPVLDIKDAIRVMLEKYDLVKGMFYGYDYKRYFNVGTKEKLEIILEAQEHILAQSKGKDKFIKYVNEFSRAFTLVVPLPQAMAIKEELAFFQAVKARLIKYEPQGNGKSDAEIESAIRQLVDKAVVSDGIVDIFDAAGIQKPDISILSDEFLEEVKNMKHKNLALELLKKLLNDEIRARSKTNFIQSKKLSEMLEEAINKYQNNLITTAQVIEELIKLADEIKKADKRGEELGLSTDEIAFYDALADNESAKEVLGDDKLRELARILADKIRENATIDWTIKESVRAKLKVIVKRTLRRYGYPPDKQKIATENVIKQAELLANAVVEE